MAELLSDPRVLWAVGIVLVLPIAIIAAGEVEERLRQRDSALTRVASVIRQWTIPLLAVWVLVIGLFDVDQSNVLVRLVATALLASVLAVALMLIGLLIARISTGARLEDRRRVPQLLLALPKVAAILTVGWVLVDGVWGVDLSAALTALGVTSLVVSFALQDTLSGLASGFLLLADAPFGPGDWIRAGDVEGRVVDIKWRSSRIETRTGDVLIVPNAYLAGAVVTNFDQPTRVHRVTVPVQVAFANPPTLAKEMLLDAARSVDGVLADPPPAVRVVQIDDPLMGYEVHMWIDDYAVAPRVSSDFGSMVWYQSHRHNVPLPSPAFDLFHHDTSEEEPLSPIEMAARIRTSPLLSQISEEDVAQLAGSSRQVRYQRGELMTGAGADGDLYVLWEGSAAIVVMGDSGESIEVSRLDQGDLVGLVAQSADWPRPFGIRATDDCEVIVIPGPVAGDVANRNTALSRALDHIAAARTRRVDRAMSRFVGEPETTEGPEVVP